MNKKIDFKVVFIEIFYEMEDSKNIFIDNYIEVIKKEMKHIFYKNELASLELIQDSIKRKKSTIKTKEKRILKLKYNSKITETSNSFNSLETAKIIEWCNKNKNKYKEEEHYSLSQILGKKYFEVFFKNSNSKVN